MYVCVLMYMYITFTQSCGEEARQGACRSTCSQGHLCPCRPWAGLRIARLFAPDDNMRLTLVLLARDFSDCREILQSVGGLLSWYNRPFHLQTQRCLGSCCRCAVRRKYRGKAATPRQVSAVCRTPPPICVHKSGECAQRGFCKRDSCTRWSSYHQACQACVSSGRVVRGR
jgi:hypothetical protein